jgi:peroxiredoxin/outer membrane lipoprotein-sorting protein
MPRAIPFALLVLLLATPGFAQAPPDAQSLLQRAGDAYRALRSYQVESTMDLRQVTGSSPEQTLQAPIIMAGDRSGRVRLEIRHEQAGALFLSDGHTLTSYMAQLKQYTQKPAAARADTAMLITPPPGSPMQHYFALPAGVRSATVEGPGTVELDGRSHDCWIVRADLTPEQALAADSAARAISYLWLDRATGLVLRDSQIVVVHSPKDGTTQVTTRVLNVTHQVLDAPVPDSVFAFVPPVGAKKVDAFGPPESIARAEEFLGKPAPAFTLTGVKGSTVSLANYKGKVVLLDFWATWCRPCRIEMPLVQKLYNELKPKGLVVFGVNLMEEPAQVKRFLADNQIGFPILLDREGKVAESYKAEGIPTLVIVGKDGKVSSYFTGLREEEVLRAALAKAGMK